MADLTNLKTALAVVDMEIRYLDAQLTSDRASLALALTKVAALQEQLDSLLPPDPDGETVAE